MKNLRKDNKGFSLVELLVVIAIMVVLVGVVAPSLLRNVEKAKEAKDVQTLDTIAGVLQTAMASEKGSAGAQALITSTGIEFYTDLYNKAGLTGNSKAYAEEVKASIVLSGISDDFGSKLATKSGNRLWVSLDANGKLTVKIVGDSDTTAVSNNNVTLEVKR